MFFINYCTTPGHTLVTLLVSWLIWPGLMFLVGAIFESRLIPIGRGQSWAFIPGDFSLGVMATALLVMYTDTGKDIPLVGSACWWIPVIVVLGVIAVFWHRNDVSYYPPRAGRSPTKILHNFVGYFLFPVILVGLGVPQIVEAFVSGMSLSILRCWLIFVAALAFYLVCVLHDTFSAPTAKDIYRRHPDDWRPIWKK